MKIRTGVRHVREGSRNIIRNGWMTFASASAISISLFILGVFLLLALNVNHLADQIEKQVEINVYLELDTPHAVIDDIEKQIAALPEVSKVTFVSKEEGLKQWKKKFGKDGDDIFAGYEGDDNPLNDSFIVEVYKPRDVAKTADTIKALNAGRDPAPIYKAAYGKGTVEKLFKVTRIVRNGGLVVVVLLAFTAVFLIANTIKLTIIARRREIGIMKLVGATNQFIRWPFFIEGALLGFFGSILPVVLLLAGYGKLVDLTKTDAGMFMVDFLALSQVSLPIIGLLGGLGIAIGIWGSTISVRKYLKV